MWVVAITALLVIGPTSADECRKLKDVLASMKDFTINYKYGGHAWVHSFMADPKAQNTKVKPNVGDPVFNNKEDLRRLWEAWAYSDLKGVHCGDGKMTDHAVDCVEIRPSFSKTRYEHIIPYTFSKCAGVNKDHSRCIEKQSDTIGMKAVMFEYRFRKFRENNGEGWILFDAIPSANSNCQ